MRQGISSATIPPPLTLRDCLVSGRVDLARYTCYARSSDLYDELEEEDITMSRKRKHNDGPADINKKNKRLDLVY